MSNQKTDLATIENEKQLVKNIAGLSGVDEILLNDRGWDSRVYSFKDGQYFFKFPRSEKIQSRYKYEIAAIKLAASIDSGVRIQKILWEHPRNAYFGYEGIQGTPLNELATILTDSDKHAIGKVIGDFLKLFHQLKLPDARTRTIEDEATQIQRWYTGSLATIHKVFTDEEQRKLRELVYEIWPIRLRGLGSDPVLSHGDLHFENILYSKDGDIGIIDFGDIAYWDRSKDFLELENDKVVFEAALEVYGNNSPQFMEKVLVRQAMIQIINLGFHAGKNDGTNIAITVNKIKQNLS